MRKWTLLLTCSLLFLGRPCRADEEFEGARGAAKRVIELVRAKKDEDLKKFAAEPGVDPWLIVDALLEAQANDAAKAYAAAHEGKDAEALRAVAARGLKEPSDARTRLAAAEAALAAPIPEDGDPEAIAESIIASLKGGESIPDGILRVRWLMIRATALARAGRYREQAADLALASEIARGLEWIDRAISLIRDSAQAARDDQDLGRALDAWNRFKDMEHSIGEFSGEALGLMNVAEIHQRFGETREGLARISEALRVLPDGAATAGLRWTLRARHGALLVASGDLRGGQVELIGAIEMLSNFDAMDLADALTDLGNIQTQLGDYASARRSHERALAAYRSVEPSSPRRAEKVTQGIATSLANLASVAAYDGKYAEAFDGYRTQRTSFLDSKDKALAARALQGMAASRILQAVAATDPELRRRWIEEAGADAANAVRESQEASDPEGELRAKGTLAEVDERHKHYDEAIRKYEDVVSAAQRQGLFDIVLEYSVALARARLARENIAGAIEAVELGYRRLTTTFSDLGDQSRTEARAQHAELFDIGMRAALLEEPGMGIPHFFRFLEAGRATALLDAIENRDVLRSRRIPPTLESDRAAAARAVVDRRNEIGAVARDRERVKEAERQLELAQVAYGRAVDAIQQSARSGAHLLYPQPISLADAQRLLKGDEALVLYAAVNLRAYALVVTPVSTVPILLGSATELTADCQRSMSLERTSDFSESAGRAIESIWAPVAKLLTAKTTMIYVSPDGSLGLVPYSAFGPSAASRSFLFVPSASILRVLREAPPPAGSATLAVGISDYSALPKVDGGALRGRGVLSNLPAAEAEAKEIGAGDGNRAIVGPNATEDAVLREITAKSGWSALHFAVHGRTDSRNPTLASLALAPSASDDGDLTAFEIFQHDIPARVAVLAACESAAGGVVRGEGLVGLVRAFIFAGCPSVVASLWNADDDAAKVFSVAFHQEWRKSGDLVRSLNAARSKVRANPKWTHPFYWAGWCAWGEQYTIRR